MIAIEKDIEKYMSEVNSHLFCLRKNKKAVLEDIREAILEFTQNNEVETMDVIYARFGTPEEIAKAYIADAEPQNIKKAINIRKMLVAAVVILILSIVIFLVCSFLDLHGDGFGEYTVTIAENKSYIEVCINNVF